PSARSRAPCARTIARRRPTRSRARCSRCSPGGCARARRARPSTWTTCSTTSSVAWCAAESTPPRRPRRVRRRARSQRLDRGQDRARRVALVERVEVHARRAGLEQAPALADGVLDADRHHDRGVLLEALEARAQLVRDLGTAHLREALDLR